jgi:SAM-dependent methyltransferase
MQRETGQVGDVRRVERPERSAVHNCARRNREIDFPSPRARQTRIQPRRECGRIGVERYSGFVRKECLLILELGRATRASEPFVQDDRAHVDPFARFNDAPQRWRGTAGTTQRVHQDRGVEVQHGERLDAMTPAADSPGGADVPKLSIDLGLGPRRLPPDDRIEGREHADTLGFAQPPDPFGVLLHGFTDHLTLRLVGALGRLPQAGHGRLVERERDLYHTVTILPYLNTLEDGYNLRRETVTVDPHAFHEFERSGWERASAHYQDAFGALTRQTADPLLDAAGVGSDSQVLDVATGPGPIAAAAATRGADVVGLDFSAAMIAEAKRQHPTIVFREGDAEALPFAASSFDAVVMNFGLLHLARPDTAIAEAHRVLRGGGRYALTVWAPPEEAIGFGLVLAAVRDFGNPDVALPEGPPFFRFSSHAEFRRTLEHAGFTEVQIQTLALSWRVSSSDAVFDAISRGGVRTAAVLRAQTPAALEAIRTSVRQGVEKYKKDGVFLIPMPAVLASGTRSGSRRHR